MYFLKYSENILREKFNPVVKTKKSIKHPKTSHGDLKIIYRNKWVEDYTFLENLLLYSLISFRKPKHLCA